MSIITLFEIMKKLLKVTLLILLTLIAWLLYLSFKTPSNNANWQTQYQILPTVELNGDNISIKNVRDFRYHDDGSITQTNYVDNDYQLSQFKRAWYGISHFGDNNLAHVFISFEFENKQYLVVSIEARLEQEQTYGPIKGVFRAFTKTVVLGTEQDVIGLRSHIRKEKVFLYPLDVPELYTKPLLLNFLREAQVLTRKPTFYNTLIDNCMTGLLAQSDQFRHVSSWLDSRIVLPGGSDEIAYELGFIDTTLPLDKLRQSSLIEPNKFSIDDEAFSDKIRK